MHATTAGTRHTGAPRSCAHRYGAVMAQKAAPLAIICQRCFISARYVAFACKLRWAAGKRSSPHKIALREIIQMPNMHKLWLGALAGASIIAGNVLALEWSDNEIQYLRGKAFHEPYNSADVSKQTVTFQHADGHAYGRNFLFVDALKSDDKDASASEFYGEGYASFSLGKLGGTSLSHGMLRDINLTAGINYGHKSYANYSIDPRVLLPGISVDLNLPGFAFFNFDILAYIDRGRFAGNDNGCNADTHQLTPAWKLPFSIAGEKFSFEGFVDVIGAHGNCARQVLGQPQLRWDIGNHFGQAGKLFLGIEYQYWNNKYGVRGVRDSFPEALLLWKF